jgi:hypothetical protein
MQSAASRPRVHATSYGWGMAAVVPLLLAGCTSNKPGAPSAQISTSPEGGVEVQHASLTAVVNSTRFVSREHFLAGGEMQISGEPLAEAMGRDLGAYNRNTLPTDVYQDPSSPEGGWLDLPGFSTGVESYEYSKQPMNSVAFESGAGTSLVYGPLVNPNGLTGAAATALLAARVQHFAAGSNAAASFVFPAGTFLVNGTYNGDRNPTGAGTDAENPLGWPGIWPTTHVFRSFDPSVNPSSDIALACSITSDDNRGKLRAAASPDYECDATSLHLPNRAAQVEPIVTPGADGFSAWKYGLWALNYLQVMHDSGEFAVDTLAFGSPDQVGVPGNNAFGGGRPLLGVYLGSSRIEGFQAQIFIDAVDNRAEDWLMHLTTTDGVALSGFSTLLDALSYDYEQPLRWFPGQLSVTETDDGSGFPRPAYAIASPDSHLLDQVGLLLGYSEFYALTDLGNADVGGATAASVFFDGDPFASDDQAADGEATLHDRALAMLRVAFINIDRLHRDPVSGVLVDDVTLAGSAPTRGTTVSTTSVAETILALRTTLRATSSQLKLYSNNSPDTVATGTPLDTLPLNLAGSTSSFSQHMAEVLSAQAELLISKLTDATGRAWIGWDIAAGAPTDQHDLLDAHTAAVRGLFAAYLATGEVRYRDRAVAVFNRLESVFYDSGARIYDAAPAPQDSVEYTPVRFALLQSTLRDMYELVASRPGGEALEPLLEERLGRLNKLVLNGWDDRNQNRIVDWPDECVNVRDGLPRGGLQMAERTLTGETGALETQYDVDAGEQRTPTSDREHDCVPEIDDAHLPAALADSVVFQVARQ